MLYVVVPVIMLFTFLVGIYASRKVTTDFRLSATAGLYAGLVAFAIYAVSSFSTHQALSLRVLRLPGFHLLPVIIGAVLGFTLLQIVQFFKLTTGLVGLFVMF